jgi:hypothetical protein
VLRLTPYRSASTVPAAIDRRVDIALLKALKQVFVDSDKSGLFFTAQGIPLAEFRHILPQV